MSCLETKNYHEPPRYDHGVRPINRNSITNSNWLEVVVNDRDKKLLYADCEMYEPPTTVALDMRWIRDIKDHYGTSDKDKLNDKLYLIIDDIGCVLRVDKTHKDCNVMIDTDGYLLRRYEQPYNSSRYSNSTKDKYYWLRPNCLYNDKIHHSHTKCICNSLMIYHKMIELKNSK